MQTVDIEDVVHYFTAIGHFQKVALSVLPVIGVEKITSLMDIDS